MATEDRARSRKAGPTRSGAETEQLRDEIDRGRQDDKVDFPDPAAAPLGTDDEAAGLTTDARRIEEEREANNLGESHPPGHPVSDIEKDPMRSGHVWDRPGEAASPVATDRGMRGLGRGVFVAALAGAVLVILWLSGAF